MTKCGCKIKIIYAYSRTDTPGLEIVHCPIHAAAPELLAVSRLIAECPYTIEPATVPKGGIDKAPEQVVGTMHVGLLKRRRLRAVVESLDGI